MPLPAPVTTATDPAIPVWDTYPPSTHDRELRQTLPNFRPTVSTYEAPRVNARYPDIQGHFWQNNRREVFESSHPEPLARLEENLRHSRARRRRRGRSRPPPPVPPRRTRGHRGVAHEAQCPQDVE